ncbi:AbiJ-NTD4 domain-containing protein [Acinetobacter terrae]|uniref:HEPN AbiJ-N-terminal domain-containing protein n=1 Tax=Acinetobacter terrae TaxID=2731247 RepID=A0A8E4MFF9_9GAMM|nr:hypothetical protein [Acinetobacter terrae]NNH38211.1 hypothetical protein [Acinetobacter terrae]
MRFSERYRYKTVREIIQRESITEELRNRIWSAIYSNFLREYESLPYNTHFQLIDDIFSDFLKKPLDNLSIVQSSIIKEIRITICKSPWYEIYDFLEFILNNNYINQRYYQIKKDNFLAEIEKILTEENSAYRVIYNQIVEITSEQEIQSIENALENTNQYSGVQQHLNQALKLMSDRQNPNYSKSMHDSISAVEGLARLLLEDDSITLGKAIPRIRTKYELHPTLMESLNKLYGYTSDEAGVRHGSAQESNLSYIDAKFMLVACTNFINYLIEKTK